jgi:hypothetical protein
LGWIIGTGIFLLLFLLLFFIFPRAVLGLIAVAAVGIGAMVFIDYQNSAKQAKKRANVFVAVFHDPKKCSEENPLFIQINNKSGSTLKRVSFIVTGYRTGYSKPVYQSSYKNYESDRIIENDTGWGNCWSVPKLDYGVPKDSATLFPAKTMNWKAENIRPTFQP